MFYGIRAHRARPAPTLAVCLVALALAGTATGVRADEEIAIHGFLSQGFMGTRDYDYLAQSADGTFQFSEMGVNFSSEVRDDLRIGMQVFARDLGTLGNNRVELDWAYGDYSWTDALGFRAGKIKMPYGLYNETRDVDALRTAVLMPQGVYDQRFRDFMVAMAGASLYGSTPWTRAGSLEYQGFWGMSNVADDGSVAQVLNATGQFTFQDFVSRHTAGGTLVWNTPMSGLRFGSSFTHFDFGYSAALTDSLYTLLSPFGGQPVEAIRSKNTRVFTNSVELSRGNLLLASEHTLWLGDLENPYVGVTLNREGWYGLASYRFGDSVELGQYYSVFYQDRDDKEGANAALAHMAYQKDLTSSLRLDVNDFWMVKAEIHFIRGTALLLTDDNFAEGGENWILLAGKTSFIF